MKSLERVQLSRHEVQTLLEEGESGGGRGEGEKGKGEGCQTVRAGCRGGFRRVAVALGRTRKEVDGVVTRGGVDG